MLLSTTFDRRLGEHMRKCRISLGLSQDQVVARASFAGLDICQEVYSRIELGTRSARAHELAVFAVVLNIDLSALISLQGCSF